MPESDSGRFPNEPTFIHLLQNASQVDHVIIHDAENGVDATYSQLLADVTQTQRTLRQSLRGMFDPETNLLQEANPCCLILTPGNYEFVVAGLAILSIGGAFAPLALTLLREEALHIFKTSQAVCILADEPRIGLARRCKEYAAEEGLDLAVLPIDISASRDNKSWHGTDFNIDQSLVVTPNRPALLLYTSGTTGPPKGVVLDRRLFYDMHGSTSPTDVVMSHASVVWASALLSLFAGVLGGARTEFTAELPDVLWERLRKGGITMLGCHPIVWSWMREYFNDRINHLAPQERDAYLDGLRSLRTALTRGTMPDPAMLQYWNSLGKRLHVCYGITELGGTVMKTTDDTDINLECTIGRPVPGVAVRLSNGDHGELLVKKTVMFTRYIHGAEDGSASFTDDGFYKTGDLVRRVGDDYVLEGRSSADFIRFRGLKVPILRVEHHLLGLPCVEEGCILPVCDAHYGQRVAALIRLRKPSEQGAADASKTWTLERPYLGSLRDRLGETLPAYMLPSALRVLRDGEDLPRTPSLKVIRAEAAKQYFPLSKSFGHHSDVELHAVSHIDHPSRKAWDRGGIT